MQSELKSFMRRLLDLREGAEEKRTIIENIKDDGDFSSARFWSLVCAIGVASVGLNINSIPVIIGAMLISPLMGPIVSMGMALAIYDWGLLRRSFRNLLILTAISIFISTIYFALSPISTAQSELLARTEPTLFDVLIAIFGGVAGFIGISRAKHNNIIPGVAIATALIPPLCTVGYGIGTGQLTFILGAFYLFLINCIFICLSSLIVAKYMKLPKREYPDEAHRHRVNRIITALTIIIVAPAVYLAYTFVGESQFNSNVDRYLTSVFTNNGHIIVFEDRDYHRTGSTIEIAFLAEHFEDTEIATFTERLGDFDLDNTTLTIRQNAAQPEIEDWNKLLIELKGQEAVVATLEEKLKEERAATKAPKNILSELQALEPTVTDIAIGSLTRGSANASPLSLATVYYDASYSLTPDDSLRITSWLRTRLQEESLTVTFEPPVATFIDALEDEVLPE